MYTVFNSEYEIENKRPVSMAVRKLLRKLNVAANGVSLAIAADKFALLLLRDRTGGKRVAVTMNGIRRRRILERFAVVDHVRFIDDGFGCR